jgi:hypothetical protein
MMMKGFSAMKKDWLLRPVSIWIDKSSNNNTITIVKMRVLEYQHNIAKLL